MSPEVKNGGALECPTKSLPPFVSSSPVPHLCEEGQPKNAGGGGGAKPPALIFVWPSPTRVGAAEDEVMDVMIYWGSGTPHLPDSLLVGSYFKDCSSLIWL